MSSKIFRTSSLVAAGMSLIFSTGAFAEKVYTSDQGHTEVMFGWSHAGVTRQNAEFTKAIATVTMGDSLENSSVAVEIDASSLSSGFEKLDEHLKNADFLEVETYPTINFTSTGVEMTGDKTMNVMGDLTIHGVTQAVTLAAEMTLNGPHPLGESIDYYKGEWIAFQASTEIDHQAFKVGGFSTGPIAITINTEMKAN